jgi:coproporphyrinogen III oxidase-like Fe-S oxidoreductase
MRHSMFVQSSQVEFQALPEDCASSFYLHSPVCVYVCLYVTISTLLKEFNDFEIWNSLNSGKRIEFYSRQ